MTLGERVAAAIVGSEKKDPEIAKAVGVSPQAVGQWRNGRTKNLRMVNLFALADATGYAARWIGTGEGPARNGDVEHRNTVTARIVEFKSQAPQVSDQGQRLLTLWGELFDDQREELMQEIEAQAERARRAMREIERRLNLPKPAGADRTAHIPPAPRYAHEERRHFDVGHDPERRKP